MQTLKIEAYSLFEFCQQVQDAVKQNFVFDFDSNENFPTAFGSLLVAGMVKSEPKIKGPTELVVEDKPEVLIEGSTEVKRGRKPKDNT